MSNKQLKVAIVEARNLKDTDIVTKNDAYVEVYMNKDHKKRTAIVKNSNSPTWHETFIFDLRPDEDLLSLKVYDDDIIGRDDVGGTKIHLKQVQQAGGHLDLWVNLPTIFGRGSNGEIHVVLWLTEKAVI